MKTKLLLSFYVLLISQMSLQAQTSWSLTGNAGTNPPTNFLGTTDNKALVLKTNKIEQMRITNTGRVGIGTASPLQKLDVNGNINIAGNAALYIGNERVIHTTGGNFFAGQFAGNSNLASAHGNTAVGLNAFRNNTTGFQNTTMGINSLGNNSTGDDNAAFGVAVLNDNTTGHSNTASGAFALFSNITGNFNTASGDNALYYNTAGIYNTAFGEQALFNSTGDDNTASGSFALKSNTSGNNNTAIGYSADVSSGDLHNSTAIGNAALITASNQVRIGNSSVTSIGGYVNWSNISDGRFKKNIKEDVKGLEFIMKLKPVSYNLDITGLNTFQRKNMKAPDGKTYSAPKEDAQEIKAKEQVVYNGFVAQDVEKAAKETGYTFSGVDAPKNDNDVYGLRYADFVVPLVKAVQELSLQNDALKSKNQELESRLANIEQMLAVKNSSTVTLSAARLEQNAPNPFNQNTIINYYLPEDIHNARIAITDANGRLVKVVPLTTKGNGQFVLEGGQLAAGAYQYSLIVNEKAVDTKKMVILR